LRFNNKTVLCGINILTLQIYITFDSLYLSKKFNSNHKLKFEIGKHVYNRLFEYAHADLWDSM